MVYAGLFGVFCHQVIFRSYEVDSHGWEMVLAYVNINAGLVVGYGLMGTHNLMDVIMHVCLAGAVFLVGLYGSLLLYRAFFHRLHRFPGPFLARLSKVYQISSIINTKMQYHMHVPKLQRQYGDFIRTGPRELTVLRAEAIDLIYGSSSPCTKGTWYDQNSGNADKVGIENVRDKEKHRVRRKAWDRALSVYEPRIKGKVDALMTRYEGKQSVNVTRNNILYAWDVMGDIAFSKDFHMLKTGVEHPAVEGLHWAMAIAGVVTTLPWLMNMLRVIPGATGKFEKFASWCSGEVDLKREALASEQAKGMDEEPSDVMSWIIKAQQEKQRSAPPTESAIREDARTLISAGSDTIAIAFTNFLYLMVKNPEAYKKLQKLLDAEFPGGYNDWAYDNVKRIPYIDCLIHETLRLRPPVPMGFLRETPDAGLQVGDVFIPGKINVNVPIWAMQRDERYFDRALDFIPERWETLSPESSAYFPFQRGGFSCVGKANAMMQIRMLISATALQYNLAFAPGEDGERFGEGTEERLTLWIPPLYMTFHPR
ncbi:hypothetical protein JX265_012677 [Neoarthrinium moseri]|uniref:Cytochrome P450 n=1 Tax=Neoarthrinium moseri TaxID=1658444 RepID=A0A9Q0AJI8_9PEZI|nr:hypothetical protein JX266_011265 [Neoarthrinium moseri]KAI1853846.1 hypothetical protein JX265_012677 [Neoarthrinium moseri]